MLTSVTNDDLPEHFDMTVALNSDMGLVCGLIRSVQSKADKLLRPDERVLKYIVKEYVVF